MRACQNPGIVLESPPMFSSALTSIAPDLWQVERSITMPGGAVLPCRSVIARLPDAGLWIWSPVRFDEVASQVNELGAVKHIVAPNQFHHLQFPAAAALWPQAHTWACPGLRAKRPDIAFHHELADTPPAAWSSIIDQRLVAGMPKVEELVFLHKPSRTLIVADLLFNILEPQGLGMKITTRLFGTYKKLAVSRLFRLFVKEKPAFAASLKKILAWDFDRLVPGHGSIVETGAKERVAELFAPFLGAGR